MTQSTIPLTLTPLSDQLHGYGYDAANQILAVEYKSNHAQVTYQYRGVPPEVITELEEAKSKGAVVFRRIKGKFDFDRMVKEVQEV